MLNGRFYFVAAYAISPDAVRLYHIQHLWIKISLHGIMHVKAIFRGRIGTGIQRFAQDGKVVVIEWSFERFKAIYGINVKHCLLFHLSRQTAPT